MIQTKEVAYWEQYYEKNTAPVEPSLFAKYVVGKYLTIGQSLTELGCGNGRDAHYFAEKGLDVTAIDQCESEIDKLITTNGQYPNLNYVAGDFTKLSEADDEIDVIYSRFTLHSVTAQGQKDTLDWSYRNLSDGGLICIETRGQKNELFGKGKPVVGEPDAFIYEDHYRRFVEFSDFKDQIVRVGFRVIEAAEKSGFAPFRGTDYDFIRIIAQK